VIQLKEDCVNTAADHFVMSWNEGCPQAAVGHVAVGHVQVMPVDDKYFIKISEPCIEISCQYIYY
jgi:hypothetical protein